MSEKTISQERLNIYCRNIRKDFGIDLTWSEKIALKYYINSFNDWMMKENQPVVRDLEGVVRFMKDYFGLDSYELSGFSKLNSRGRYIGALGYDFIDDPEKTFQEYCRRNVQQFRDERELI